MSTEFAISRFCVPFLQEEGWALFADCDILCWEDVCNLFSLADDRFAVMLVKHEQPSQNTALQGMEEKLASFVSAIPGSAKEEKLQKLCSILRKTGQDREDAVREMRGEQFADAPSGLRETLANCLALPSLPFSDPSLKMDGQLQTFYSRKNWSSVVLWNCGHPANKQFTLENLNTWPGRDLHAFKWLQNDEIGELPQRWNWLVNVTPGEPERKGIWHYTLGGPWFTNWRSARYDDDWLLEAGFIPALT